MRLRLLIPLLLMVTCLLSAGLARAELSQDGNVRISFKGNFSPNSLPRDRLAPISIDIHGAIGTTDGTRPPAVRKIEIALNRNGKLSTKGLPGCTGAQLQATSTAVALQRCRQALVGRGRFSAEVEFPNPVLATGTLLTFYGRSSGRPALFFHLHATTPVRTTFVLPLKISHRPKGLFGTVLSARIPTLAGGLGSVTEISTRIGREYRYRGQRLSFISASCPAPAGFPGALFSLARGSFHFADGKRIETTLARNCRVR